MAQEGAAWPAPPRRPQSLPPRHLWREWMAIIWPAVGVSVMLTFPALGVAGPILFLLLVAVQWVPISAVPMQRVIRCWPYALLFLFAMLSTLWSTAPLATLRYSAQLAITMIAGLMMGACAWPRRVMLSYAVGLVATVALGLVFGQSAAWGAQGDTAFVGLGGGKNYFADWCATALVMWVGAMAAMGPGGRGWRLALSLPVVAVLLAGLISTHSTGSTAALAISCLLMAAMGVMRLLRPPVRAAMLALALALVGVGSVAMSQPEVRSEILHMLNKDENLTGRRYLWYRGQGYMDERPWLGTGYGAFWLQGNLDAEGLWYINGITGRKGFNFHNIAIETRVNMGLVGFGLLVALCLGAVLSILAGFLRRPLATDLGWLGFALYEMSRVTFETVGPTPFTHDTLLFCSVMGYAAVRRLNLAAQER